MNFSFCLTHLKHMFSYIYFIKIDKIIVISMDRQQKGYKNELSLYSHKIYLSWIKKNISDVRISIVIR